MDGMTKIPHQRERCQSRCCINTTGQLKSKVVTSHTSLFMGVKKNTWCP